jgi:hypothetical protein
MAHVEAAALVDRDADALWREIGSFRAVGEWHPMLARVEANGEAPGALRTAKSSIPPTLSISMLCLLFGSSDWMPYGAISCGGSTNTRVLSAWKLMS